MSEMPSKIKAIPFTYQRVSWWWDRPKRSSVSSSYLDCVMESCR